MQGNIQFMYIFAEMLPFFTKGSHKLGVFCAITQKCARVRQKGLTKKENPYIISLKADVSPLFPWVAHRRQATVPLAQGIIFAVGEEGIL